MDTLPIPEDTGAEYASTVDGTMLAWYGRDAHVAMLIGTGAHALDSTTMPVCVCVCVCVCELQKGHCPPASWSTSTTR